MSKRLHKSNIKVPIQATIGHNLNIGWSRTYFRLLKPKDIKDSVASPTFRKALAAHILNATPNKK